MNCPVCEGATAVINSRPEPDSVNRSRKCLSCGFRFRTVELDRDMLEAGFLFSAKDTLDLTEVKEAVKHLKEASNQLNKFMERVNQ